MTITYWVPIGGRFAMSKAWTLPSRCSEPSEWVRCRGQSCPAICDKYSSPLNSCHLNVLVLIPETQDFGQHCLWKASSITAVQQASPPTQVQISALFHTLDFKSLAPFSGSPMETSSPDLLEYSRTLCKLPSLAYVTPIRSHLHKHGTPLS